MRARQRLASLAVPLAAHLTGQRPMRLQNVLPLACAYSVGDCDQVACPTVDPGCLRRAHDQAVVVGQGYSLSGSASSWKQDRRQGSVFRDLAGSAIRVHPDATAAAPTHRPDDLERR